MSLLRHRTPAQFGVELRRRISALPQGTPLLVVEGKSDRQMLQRYINNTVRVVPANSKSIILGSMHHLSEAELDACTFLIDCDGEVDSDWRGRRGVIISQYRDLDADTAFLSDGMNRAVLDYICVDHEHVSEAEHFAANVILLAKSISTAVGVVLDAAASAGYRTRVRDDDGNRRRVRLGDLDSSASWIAAMTPPTLEDVASELSQTLAWTSEEAINVVRRISEGGKKRCRYHRRSGCAECMVRRFCNGHYLHSFLAEILTEVTQRTIAVSDVARAIRVGASLHHTDWHVIRRLYLRGAEVGLEYVQHRDVFNHPTATAS